MARYADLTDDLHMSSYPWKCQLWRKTKVQKVALFRFQEAYPVASYVLAVVELQRLWRGVLLRRRVLARYLHKSFKRRWRAREDELLEQYHGVPKPEDEKFLPCLKRLQARIRTCLLRREYVRWVAYDKHSIYYISACTIQRRWKKYKFQKSTIKKLTHFKQLYLSREDACAARIQDAWRGYVNRQIYSFYVDLIKFRERGDPQMMLKCINPKEANLFDSASGLHVRFRLGGATFPPQVYYKIFTHAPVSDICSFAPKDYIDAKHKEASAMMKHSKCTLPEIDKKKWYKRHDMNEWRAISDKILLDAEQIVEQPAYSIPKDVPWHHSNLKRKEDVQKKIKKRRRRWLKELYTQEQLALAPDEPSKRAVEQEANALFDQMDDRELEEEVGRLVQWTKDLDYQSYREDWLLVATTAGSDYQVVGGEA
eukprot:TRINITY_DN18598_c0_g1_i1.p1 TRINITY_DN18598_c0_g1~~TRINITY_DN18598_c0_g1_i1.p1  ORF type:complete len:425 (+),score=192.44 TRINITY_DN18598_c0_g1_i1:85-1359(+)